MVKPYSELLAEAVVLLAEGNHTDAINRAREALEAIQRSGDAQIAHDQIRDLHAIVNHCNAALSSPKVIAESVGEAASNADHTGS